MTKKSLNSFKVQFSVDSSSNNISFEFTLPELQDIVDPFFNRTEEIVDDVLAASGWTELKITDLVLLGGSSKLSTICNAVKSKFLDSTRIHSSVTLIPLLR